MNTRSGASPSFCLTVHAAWLLVPIAWWSTCETSPWVSMWTVAGALFLVLKLVTLTTVDRGVVRGVRAWAYLLLWPGMNPQAFLDRAHNPPRAAWSELAFAAGKLACGATAFGWAVSHVTSPPPLVVGWVAMTGIVFCLHFGALHLVSWCWRRAGVLAPPIMRAPILATSLAEFWSERWNVAFADAARRLLFRPLARRAGARLAGLGVFLVSGLVHEIVISLPARGGWGAPTLYFLLQAAGIAVEKSAPGRALGFGAGLPGWIWTLLVTVLPVPLLLHAPFVERVIFPFVEQMAVSLP